MVRLAPARSSAPVRVLLAALAVLGGFACAAAQTIPPLGIGDPYYPALGNPGFDIERYDLSLDVDMDSGELRAVAKIAATATAPLPSLHLDLSGLRVDGVALGDHSARFERGERELVVIPPAALAAGDRFELTVRYHGVPEVVPDPAVPVPGVGWIRHRGAVFVLSEVGGARSFVPSNDHPADKALWTFRITVDEPFVAAANGLLTGTQEIDGRRTFTYASESPMATYLATVAIGEMEIETAETADGLPLRFYFPPGTPEGRRRPFRRTEEMIALFQDRFGPYPFESFGGVLATLPIPAALETQTLPVYGLFAGRERVIAHELAHQWFGNSVSVRDWRDIFISEGLAEYGAWLWLEHDEGEEAFADHLEGHEEAMRAMRLPPPYDPGVDELFGSTSYIRGPFTVHALRLAVGDERFFAILQEFSRRFRHANASVADFVAVAEELAGEPAREVLEAWLYDDGIPPLP